MRIDGQELRSGFFERLELVAQLRELTMADGSGIAVNEDQHDGLFAAEITQANFLSRKRRQLKIGSGLTEFRGIDLTIENKNQ